MRAPYAMGAGSVAKSEMNTMLKAIDSDLSRTSMHLEKWRKILELSLVARFRTAQVLISSGLVQLRYVPFFPVQGKNKGIDSIQTWVNICRAQNEELSLRHALYTNVDVDARFLKAIGSNLTKEALDFPT